MNKIRKLCKVETNFKLLKVKIVVAATGTVSIDFAGIVINVLGLNLYIMGGFFYWVLISMLLIPVYQVLLIVYLRRMSLKNVSR